MGSDNTTGVLLALTSSIFIGVSFIVKKKGLIRARSSGSGAASAGGHAYLNESLWWAGLLTMIVGEVENFAAYAFAPAILVTPLGALSVIVSAVLASWLLDEKLDVIGKLGCGLCVVGSTVIVLNAPEETEITSVEQITIMMATNGVFQLYCALVLSSVLILIYHYAPLIGKKNQLVYVSVCSLVGSISVIGVKGLSISLKLTFSGNNQLDKGSFWLFVILVAVSITTQMNYLNKALDTFNTAVVTPIYYVLFTTATIIASAILFNGWGMEASYNHDNEVNQVKINAGYGAPQFITVLCGFITIVTGVYLLHAKRGDEIEITRVPQTVPPEPSTTLPMWDEEDALSVQQQMSDWELNTIVSPATTMVRSGSTNRLRLDRS
eukprot:m.60763 g.60763  ORF g.60763 m.60763 type:complete len:380 (+) comp22882_c0_seq1:284-1423(+)